MFLTRRARSGIGWTGGVLFLAFTHACAVSEPADPIDELEGGGPSRGGSGGSTTFPTSGGSTPTTGSGGSEMMNSSGGRGSKSSGGSGGRSSKSSGGSSSNPFGKGGSAGTGNGRGGATSNGGAVNGGRGGAGGSSNTSRGGATNVGGRASSGGRSNGGIGGGAGKSGTGVCDFESAACASKDCGTACPANMGTYCQTACQAIIDCVEKNPTCGTAADPMCVERKNGAPNTCTTQWEAASGGSSPPGAPAKAAQDFYDCACGG